MNMLFLTLLDFDTLDEQNIYTDLLRTFVKKGHNITVISPVERKKNKQTHLMDKNGYRLLKLKIGNIQKTNIIEKGLSTILIENQFKSAIKKYFKNIKFDLVMYSTPPITFANVVKYVKKRDNAKSYLLLKDIFPQNAVDLGMFSKQSLLYWFFRLKERKLYKISDRIGCMSEANVRYLLNHNLDLNKNKVAVCPNAIEVKDTCLSVDEKQIIREKYGIPSDKTVFIYGGNLGKPQGIDFLINCMKSQENNEDVFFFLVGSGTEYSKLNNYLSESGQKNLSLMDYVSREDFDKIVASCDIGMIFLDKRFTIPNFPSRLLSYMQAGIPTYAITDVNSDVGAVIKDNDFGWWSESGNLEAFMSTIKEISKIDFSGKGENARKYLLDNYTVENNYKIIMEQ
ncbi:MAG: glycosyltransferase family 4 protein [Clostridia bacterium]|nr:glycosyltransferase family 4 protein [Clostridia bacterium]